ncbi:unnamed protein product [Ophioblennius macclurei]
MLSFSLTMVRHGETQYNRDKLLQGQGVDTLLSDTGTKQGHAVGQYLRNIPFSCVFVSNLQRAMQTAEIIKQNNAHSEGMEMMVEPLLRERGFGIAEGRHKEDLKNMANAAGQSSRDFTPPGGETEDQVRLRFKKFLQVLLKTMLEKHSEPAAAASSEAGNDDASASASATAASSAHDGLHGVSVHALMVSHGAYIRVAVRHLVEDLDCSLPEGMKMSRLFSPCPNTGVSRFVLTANPSQPKPSLAAAHCVFTNRKEHLETLADAQKTCVTDSKEEKAEVSGV